MHEIAHPLFEFSRWSPWLAGLLGATSFVLAVIGRVRTAITLLGCEIGAFLVIFFVVFFAMAVLPTSHDLGYDLFGSFLWLAMSTGIAFGTAVITLLAHLIASKLRDPANSSSS